MVLRQRAGETDQRRQEVEQLRDEVAGLRGARDQVAMAATSSRRRRTSCASCACACKPPRPRARGRRARGPSRRAGGGAAPGARRDRHQPGRAAAGAQHPAHPRAGGREPPPRGPGDPERGLHQPAGPGRRAHRRRERGRATPQQVHALEAQLYALGPAPAIRPRAPTRVPSGRDVDDPLRALVAGNVRTAVVADSFGLLVAGAGETTHQEGIAALAGMVEAMASRARELLPLGEVRRIDLQAPPRPSSPTGSSPARGTPCSRCPPWASGLPRSTRRDTIGGIIASLETSGGE